MAHAASLSPDEGLHTTVHDPEAVSFRQWIAVFGALLGAFMAVLDIQITNASLNDILGAIGATFDEGGWISTSYLVAEIIVIPLTGWLAMVFGTRRYLAVNAGLFILASLACAAAWNLGSMIAFRALQGLTGGVLIPMAFNILLKTLPPSKRPMGFALFGLTATFAPAIGPTIGGWLTQHFGWQSIFSMNVLPGILLIAGIWYAVDPEPLKMKLLREGDWIGVITMALGLGSLTIVLEEGNKEDWFESPMINGLSALAVISLTIWITTALRRKNPLVNLRLLGRRNFGFGSIVNLALGMGLYGASYVLPLYLAQIQGYNSMQIGEVIMWTGMPQLFLMPLVPLLMKRIDARVLITAGVVLFAGSAFMNSSMTNLTAYDQLRFSQFVRALGMPMIMTPLTTVTTGDVGPEHAGSASGLFNMMRNLGGSIGIAMLGTLITQREHLHSAMLGESVSVFAPATQERLDALTAGFISSGADSVTAGQQALTALSQTVRREAYVMAYNDAFLSVGVVLLVCGLAIWMTRPVKGAVTAGAH